MRALTVPRRDAPIDTACLRTRSALLGDETARLIEVIWGQAGTEIFLEIGLDC